MATCGTTSNISKTKHSALKLTCISPNKFYKAQFTGIFVIQILSIIFRLQARLHTMSHSYMHFGCYLTHIFNAFRQKPNGTSLWLQSMHLVTILNYMEFI